MIESVEIVIRQPGHDDRIVRVPEGATRLGRAEDNEIVLSDVGVSRRHAQVYVSRAEITVEDLGSGNGTYHNGYRIQSQPVHDGDVIVIDPFTLVFSVHGRDRPSAAATEGRVPPQRPPPARLDVVAGAGIAGHSYPITSHGLSLGRSEEQDVVIPDPAASRQHCQIGLQQGAYVLRDLGSANGVFVNAVRVKECTLANGDLVRIGNTEMRFVSPEAAAAASPDAGAPVSYDESRGVPLRDSPARAPDRPARRRGRPFAAVLFGGALAFVTMLLVLGGVFGIVFLALDRKPEEPVVYPAQPPRWQLRLPPSLAAAPVDALFEEGRERMRERDMRGALQDFFRVMQADPGYAQVDKFAFAAGESLVVDALEKEFKARVAVKAERAAERAAERKDPGAQEAPGLEPPAEVAALEKKVAAAIDHLNANELDAAALLFEEVLAASEDPALRRRVAAQLKLIQPNIARTSADLWRRAVLAEAAGDEEEARRLFERLLAAHPANPSARAHLERL